MIHLRIDDSTYLSLKSGDYNISQLGNQLFSNFIEQEKTDIPNESILLSELESLREQEKMIKEKISIIAVQISKSRMERLQKEKEEWSEGEKMLDALKMNNPLRWAKLGGK